MNLTTAIRAANDVLPLLELSLDAEPVLSFWGTRCIRVDGHTGLAPIDALRSRSFELAAVNATFVMGYPCNDPMDRLTLGDALARRIIQIYNKSNRQISRANYITQLCCIAI